ncbi:hypothetical protein BH23PAT2_BH23PAT2_00480 [soil metagenome]
MKKDGKQSEKSKKKPQAKAAKKPVKKPKTNDTQPVEITLPIKHTPSEVTPAHVFRNRRIANQKKYDLDLDAKKYRTGLTINEWQELLKKDPSLLTSHQAKQLEKANEMAIEMARRITLNDYDEYVKDLKARQEQLDEQLVSLTHNDKSFMLTSSYLLEIATKAPQLFKSSKAALKSKLLRFLLSNLVIQDKKLVFNLKAPFDVIARCSKSQNWLLGPDSNRQPTD